AKTGRVKFPRLAVVLLGLLPPAGRRDHVLPAVAVDVADAETVREFEGAGDHVARRARFADLVHLPGLGRVLTGSEPRHLSFILLALGLPAHDEDLLAGAEQVGKKRRFVAGALPDDARLPVA